jgi:hypothetical protein
MAFCNSCGATLASDAKFCNKCGTVITGGAPASSAATIPAPTPTGGGSALKVILIVLAVVVSLGVLGIATIGFIGWHFARHSHVTHEGDHVKVETPFGSVETSKDPQQVAQEMGVDIYPGAQIVQNGAQSASFGSMHTVSANFESSDSPDKVCGFYRSKFPNANVTTSDSGHCTIVSNDKQNMVSISVEAKGDSTAFQISSVSKKSPANN